MLLADIKKLNFRGCTLECPFSAFLPLWPIWVRCVTVLCFVPLPLYLHAVCPAGRFGLGCQLRCICEGSGRCHPSSGRCTCGPGWTGHNCRRGGHRRTLTLSVLNTGTAARTLVMAGGILTQLPFQPGAFYFQTAELDEQALISTWIGDLPGK